jgi:hypothetical protein
MLVKCWILTAHLLSLQSRFMLLFEIARSGPACARDCKRLFVPRSPIWFG